MALNKKNSRRIVVDGEAFRNEPGPRRSTFLIHYTLPPSVS